MGITGSFRLAASVLAAVLCADASAATVIAIGPVERVSLDGSAIQVLGQTFTIRSSQLAAEQMRSAASLDMRLGTYLYIEGEQSPEGALVATSVVVSESLYVAGASEVLLSGTVSKFDQSLGLATIGSAQIYVPDASVDAVAPISVGNLVTIVGHQANPQDRIWATSIEAEDLISIQGTGVNSIQGTGKLSIQGTGKQSIQGTGVLSIQGTGVNSIQGTGKLSIQGTGKQSIQGTGVFSIQGTGANIIQGAGKLSIQGTGVLSIQGTGVNSIQGTGKLSIQGTGALSIQGTGVNSIQGAGSSSY
ncbi:MAG: DUF5666 domain-containing protein [Pseudomonadota bacterium]